MSHFTIVKNSQLIDKDLLVEALKELGWHPIIVAESHAQLKKLGYKLSNDNQSVALNDYRGSDYQDRYASIFLLRKEIGGSANDAGFLWNEETGEFEAIISEFDRTCGAAEPGRGLGPKFIGRLRAKYNELGVIKAAKAMGMEVVKTGEHQLRVVMSKQRIKPQQQQTKLQVRH